MNLRRLALAWQSRPGPLIRHLERKRYPRRHALPEVGGVRVAAIQCRLTPIPTATLFADVMYALVHSAAATGAELLVFPEEIASTLLGLFPEIGRDGGTLEDLVAELGPRTQAADVYRLLGPWALRVYLETFSSLARHFRVQICAGSIIAPDREGRLHDVAYLFGDDGSVLGAQAKFHLTAEERRWGVTAGRALNVIPTPLARVGLLVSTDALRFEPARILTLQGAEVLLVPQSTPAPYSVWRDVEGLWARAQECAVYGVTSAAVGPMLSLELEGRSAVYAPLDLTLSGDGRLAEAGSVDTEEIVVADLDLFALRELRRREPPRFNVDLYQRELGDLYGGLRGVLPLVSRTEPVTPP